MLHGVCGGTRAARSRRLPYHNPTRPNSPSAATPPLPALTTRSRRAGRPEAVHARRGAAGKGAGHCRLRLGLRLDAAAQRAVRPGAALPVGCPACVHSCALLACILVPCWRAFLCAAGVLRAAAGRPLLAGHSCPCTTFLTCTHCLLASWRRRRGMLQESIDFHENVLAIMDENIQVGSAGCGPCVLSVSNTCLCVCDWLMLQPAYLPPGKWRTLLCCRHRRCPAAQLPPPPLPLSLLAPPRSEPARAFMSVTQCPASASCTPLSCWQPPPFDPTPCPPFPTCMHVHSLVLLRPFGNASPPLPPPRCPCRSTPQSCCRTVSPSCGELDELDEGQCGGSWAAAAARRGSRAAAAAAAQQRSAVSRCEGLGGA